MSEEGRLRADEIQDVARAGRDRILRRIEKMCMGAYATNTSIIKNLHVCMEANLGKGDLMCMAQDSVNRLRYQGEADAYFNLAEAVRTIRSGNEALKRGEVGELIRYGQEKPTRKPGAGSEDGADGGTGSVEG